MYLDSNGLITQKDGDGGDKLQREGFWYEGLFYDPTFIPPAGLASYLMALHILTDLNGNLLRDEILYTNPEDVSRDQLAPNIRACSLYGFKNRLDRIFWNVVTNFSRYPNGDLAFLQDYGRFIRSFNAWYLYPFLILSDIFVLINTLLICFWLTRNPGSIRQYLANKFSFLWWLTNQYAPNLEGIPQSPYGPTNSSNDLNHIGDLQQAKEICATPISFIARKIYKKFRPKGPVFALESYFDPDTGANPEFIDLWRPIVEKF